jgi:sulfate transport system ATP-binding protein
MKFLGDTNVLSANVADGVAHAGGTAIAAPGLADGKAELYARPGDLDWSVDGPGIAASISRILDRPGGRRLLASAETGEPLELDVEPERKISPGDRGYVTLRRAKVFLS